MNRISEVAVVEARENRRVDLLLREASAKNLPVSFGKMNSSREELAGPHEPADFCDGAWIEKL